MLECVINRQAGVHACTMNFALIDDVSTTSVRVRPHVPGHDGSVITGSVPAHRHKHRLCPAPPRRLDASLLPLQQEALTAALSTPTAVRASVLGPFYYAFRCVQPPLQLHIF